MSNIPTLWAHKTVDPALVEELALKSRIDEDVIRHYLQYNMLPLHVFSSLARVNQSSISRVITPGNNMLTVVRPFPKIIGRKLQRLSGPKMILMDEKAIQFLKLNRYDSKRQKVGQVVCREEF